MKHIRIPALALTGALSLSLLLAACGGKADPTPTPELTESPAVTESVTPTETPEVSELPEDAETPDIDAPVSTPTAPAETAKPSQKPSEPTQAPSEAPSGESKVQAVWTGISAKDLPGFMDLDGETLSALYGISVDDLMEYVGKVPMVSVQATEFFIAQVKEGKMDTVKAGIAKRQADLVEQWKQYLPAQLELVENYKLVTNGNYVMFAVTEYADDVVSIFNDCTK